MFKTFIKSNIFQRSISRKCYSTSTKNQKKSINVGEMLLTGFFTLCIGSMFLNMYTMNKYRVKTKREIEEMDKKLKQWKQIDEDTSLMTE